MRILAGLFMFEVVIDHEIIAVSVSPTVFIEKFLDDSGYKSCFASTWYPIDIQNTMLARSLANPLTEMWVLEYPPPRATSIAILSSHLVVKAVIWSLEPLFDVGQPPLVFFEPLATVLLPGLLLQVGDLLSDPGDLIKGSRYLFAFQQFTTSGQAPEDRLKLGIECLPS